MSNFDLRKYLAEGRLYTEAGGDMQSLPVDPIPATPQLYSDIANKIIDKLEGFYNSSEFNSIVNKIEQSLDDKTKIPPFIDIFKYLLTKSEFINNFSVEEQKLLNDNLMQNNTTHKTHTIHKTHTTHTTKSCYNFLDKSNLGKSRSLSFLFWLKLSRSTFK